MGAKVRIPTRLCIVGDKVDFCCYNKKCLSKVWNSIYHKDSRRSAVRDILETFSICCGFTTVCTTGSITTGWVLKIWGLEQVD